MEPENLRRGFCKPTFAGCRKLARTGLVLGALTISLMVSAEPNNPFSKDARRSYETIKNALRKAAQQMPEEKYGFRPMPTDRTFGETIAEIADLQTKFCGLAKGEKNDGAPVVKKTKADLNAELEASFTYCDAVYNSMTDVDGARTINLFGEEITRLGLLNGNVAYDNQIYGVLSTYIRMNGIRLPSSSKDR